MNPETPCRVSPFQSTKNVQKIRYLENQTKPYSAPASEESGPRAVSGSLRVWEFRVPSLSGQSQAGVPGLRIASCPFLNTSLNTSEDAVCGWLIHSFIHSVSPEPRSHPRATTAPKALGCRFAEEPQEGLRQRGTWAGVHFGKTPPETGSRGGGKREAHRVDSHQPGACDLSSPVPTSPILRATL